MPFVAMPGLQLPIWFYYDALITLALALIAILIMGVAFLFFTIVNGRSFMYRLRVRLWDWISPDHY